MNFVEAINSYGRTMPKGAPPIDVIHPNYGALGGVSHKGFTPRRGRWASTRAILRDSDRKTVKDMRRLEDCAPKAIMAGVLAMLAKDPLAMAAILGAISNYDGIVAARGGGLGQDLWMTIPSFTPVTTSWYDTWQMARVPGSVPSVTAYTNAGTGGAVLTSASQGNILTDPGGTNKKYIVSVGGEAQATMPMVVASANGIVGKRKGTIPTLRLVVCNTKPLVDGRSQAILPSLSASAEGRYEEFHEDELALIMMLVS